MSDVVEAAPGDEVIASIEGAEEEAEVLASEQESESESESEVADVEEASDEELEEVLEDADASDEEVAEAAAEIKKRLTLKINGKDEEFDLDDADHLEKLKQMAQKGDGADKKFQEAAETRKKMELFAELLQNGDIGDLLKKVGRDPDKEVESYMAKKIEEMQKSPEQLRLEKLEADLLERDNRLKEIEEEKYSADQTRMQNEFERQLDDEIFEALQTTKLPKSPYVVNRIGNSLLAAIEEGNEDVTVADVLPYVEKQIQGEIREMFSAMPEEVIEAFLGDDVSNKLRKRRLSKMKETKSAASVKQTGQKEINKAKKKEKKSNQAANDFFKSLGDL